MNINKSGILQTRDDEFVGETQLRKIAPEGDVVQEATRLWLSVSTAEEHDELQLDSEEYDAGRHLPPTKVVAISCPFRLALTVAGTVGYTMLHLVVKCLRHSRSALICEHPI